MNVVEIIFSPTGGTEKVSHILGEQLGENTVKIDLSDAKTDFTKCEIAPEDMVFVAMPSFGGRRGNRAAQENCGQRCQMHPRLCVRKPGL